MSGSIASRYIGGVPYGPSMGVSRYAPQAANLPPASPIAQPPPTSVTPPGADTTIPGMGVAPGTGSISSVGGGGGLGGGSNLLAMLPALLGAAQYLPDAYRAISDLLGGTQDSELPLPPELRPPPEIPNAAPFGTSDAFGQLWGVEVQPGLYQTYNSYGQPVGSIDMQTLGPGGMDLMDDIGDLGGIDPEFLQSMSAPEGAFQSVSAPTGALSSLTDDPFYGVLGTDPIFGTDLATGIAGLGGGLVGGLMSSQVPWARQGYGAIGQQAGSAAGGIGAGALMGSAFGPIGTLFGAFGGALVGGLGGAGVGSQIGPAPTIGRNFSGFGSFDPTGNIGWAGFGGDNGGTGADAQGFGDWFTQALAQEAASRGYAFNPAAAGTSIRVGGYDNFSRRGETPGGYFYDLAAPGATFGGSPENYALRPGGLLSGGGIAGWDGGAFGPQQANAFTTNVLADLVARGVYAPAGQSGPDLGQIAGTFGADYGFYTPGASFEDALAARNWYIGTHLAQQQENARLAAAQQALIASQPTPGQYDWSGNNPNQMGYWNEGQFFPTENPYATPAGYVPVVDTSGG